MYFWNESIASHGSQEISSCLKKHFDHFIPQDTEKIILYSDACGGQNRNIKTTVMIKKKSSIHGQNLNFNQSNNDFLYQVTVITAVIAVFGLLKSRDSGFQSLYRTISLYSQDCEKNIFERDSLNRIFHENKRNPKNHKKKQQKT